MRIGTGIALVSFALGVAGCTERQVVLRSKTPTADGGGQSSEVQASQDSDQQGSGSATNQNGSASVTVAPAASGDFFAIINQHCVSCHVLGGLASTFDFASLADPASWAASPYIVPGKPEESSIYYRLRGSDVDGSRGQKDMPTGYSLTPAELAVVKAFVLQVPEASQQLDLTFDIDANRIDILPYQIRRHKLAYLLNPGSPEAVPDNLFNVLDENRYILGDHNFAQGIGDPPVWAGLQIETWLRGLEPYCRSSAFQTMYPMPSKFGEFFKSAFGRDPTPSDTETLTGLSAIPEISGAALTEAACLSFLSSVEFQTQAHPAPTQSVTEYLSRLSATINQRPLNQTEIDAIARSGPAAIETLLTTWVTAPSFGIAARRYVENLLRTNGEAEGIDFDAPGNLADYIARNGQPLANLITAEKCPDDRGVMQNCDAGAPFAAGVLTTRAFLAANKGPYNLSRAGMFLRAFACMEYPLSTTLEPQLPAEQLLPHFAARDGMGFGNGTDCWSCHSQFGHHTQFFVKFDAHGRYQATSTGIQNPDSNVAGGHSTNELYTSHFKTAPRAGQESSQFFGQSVPNLAAAAQVLAGDDIFVKCNARNLLGFYLRLKDTTVFAINPQLFDQIAARIKKMNAAPRFQDYLVAVFADPSVRESFMGE